MLEPSYILLKLEMTKVLNVYSSLYRKLCDNDVKLFFK